MASITNIQYHYTILCVGSGGTGTYFLKELSHFLGTASKKVRKNIKALYVADGDYIEEKNLSRQCFCTDDIGDNKAAAYCFALNDMLEDYGCDLKWRPLAEYITSVGRLKEIFSDEYRNPSNITNSYSGKGTLTVNIPVIISAVDNNGARKVFEEFFSEASNCFLYDSGNEYSEGQVVYAHKINDKVISPPTSHYFPQILNGDVRQVTEMSCTELNQSQPQHLATNMNAGLHLLLGMIALLEERDSVNILDRIGQHCGFVFFETFSHCASFIPYQR